MENTKTNVKIRNLITIPSIHRETSDPCIKTEAEDAAHSSYGAVYVREKDYQPLCTHFNALF